ncbi:uncharacterized protein EV420DRAFT_1476373 [Desarmillaria tabescens]|uniref:Uncharacterized protein n=1 Tax=Armillaria tabescens TaxID=1929756 RepID=A0AA39NDJ9_ARMTA|nr:uncharacterized protein EV420DRAFT_1476373 [Desarmillaria tabescens]KAK0463683.1 hypothetical protein EV420DRAFT_1476373 [Desarmillaria tabescens]
MKTTAVKILGPEAERMKDVWGLDSEGELSGIYRNSGHPGIYAMGGNLALVRFWSKRLALRIKAQVEGLAPIWVYVFDISSRKHLLQDFVRASSRCTSLDSEVPTKFCPDFSIGPLVAT